jgi:hypothetical protein
MSRLLTLPQALVWICAYKARTERNRILGMIETGRPILLGTAISSLPEIACPELDPAAKMKIWNDAVDELSAKLLQGALATYGRHNGETETRIIPADIFAGATFIDSGDSGPAVMPGKWSDLKFDLEAVEALWSLAQPTKGNGTIRRKGGRPPIKFDQTETKMRAVDLVWLISAKEEELKVKFGASRNLCRRVRNKILSQSS